MAIKLHGKEYVEVKDRVAAAHAEESYSMLREETFSMGGREYVRVFIDVKGKQYIGTAECKYNANPKTPDGQSPFECGETSALGRALGFAGYGVVDSIASADEVVSNEQQTGATGRALHALTAPGSYEQHEQANGHQADEAQSSIPSIKQLQARCTKLCGAGYWQAMLKVALKLADGVTLLDKDITIAHRISIHKYLEYVDANRPATS